MRRITRAAIAWAIALSPVAAADAAYPERPIRLLVPFPAGGTVDITARLLANSVADSLPKGMVVDNRPGAGGAIASDTLAKAPPDGYTLLLTSPNHTITPALQPNLPYDVEKDFAPVSLVAAVPELLVSPSSAPFNSFAEFVAYARAHPGEINHGHAGNGTLPHVTMELLVHRLGITVLHVPYKGAAPVMTDLLAGRVQLKFDTYATSAPHLAAGTLKALAIASLARSALLPDLPTIAESGVPGFEGILWMGVLAPARTPADIIAMLAQACAKAVASPAMRDGLRTAGIDPATAFGPAPFAALIARELPQWRDLVRDAHITAE
jgi:tripartite-type tricarboxylate transporter receptor subunit TctC